MLALTRTVIHRSAYNNAEKDACTRGQHESWSLGLSHAPHLSRGFSLSTISHNTSQLAKLRGNSPPWNTTSSGKICAHMHITALTSCRSPSVISQWSGVAFPSVSPIEFHTNTHWREIWYQFPDELHLACRPSHMGRNTPSLPGAYYRQTQQLPVTAKRPSYG